MSKELAIFVDFLKSKDLKFTNQRREILNIFLKVERHLSVDDSCQIVKKKNPAIGQSTVFRTLRLLSQAGLARPVDLGDRIVRYDHYYEHKHHDHLICTRCGKFIEAVDNRIEAFQDKLCKKFSFLPQRHRLEIFGICKGCRLKAESQKIRKEVRHKVKIGG